MAIITIEHDDGDTETWNTDNEIALKFRRLLHRSIGAADLESHVKQPVVDLDKE